MNATTLILARHGATALNLRRPYVLQGQNMDPDLDELGRKQASALAGALQTLAPAAVAASPMRRAVQTAEVVAQQFGLTVDRVPEWIECDIGIWEGRTWDDVKQTHPEEYARFLADPGETPYLGGESFAMVRDRAAPAIEAFVRRHGGEVVVAVCHNIVNRALLAHWLGLPQRYARPLPQSNGGYNVIEFHGDKATVRTIGAAHHLSGLLPPD